MPRVFISYSWEEEAHNKWVKRFADRLLENGIEAILDQYDLALGERIPAFMEKSIGEADFVLIICTPVYRSKANERTGGVGYEGHIISADLYSKRHERKYIPVIRKGDFDSAMPTYLSGKRAIDLTGKSDYENNFKDLVATIWGSKKKPSLGNMPDFASRVDNQKSSPDEPIRILGVITDKVTVPKMDGTRGSALYSIPFKLSRRPSDLWIQLFLQTWEFPPSFTTMHRPGIASVNRDEIILNGTTIEEVRDYHGDTLKLCIEEANRKEAKIIERQRIMKDQEEIRKQQHYSNIKSVADQIGF